MKKIQERLRDGAETCHARNIQLDYARIATKAADRIDALEANNNELLNQRFALMEQVAALTKDAERYRFIRVGDSDNAVMSWVNGLDDWTPWASPEDVDQSIDEAIAAIKEQV